VLAAVPRGAVSGDLPQEPLKLRVAAGRFVEEPRPQVAAGAEVAIATPNKTFFCPTRRAPSTITLPDEYLPPLTGGNITRALCDYAGSNHDDTGAIRQYYPTRIDDVTKGWQSWEREHDIYEGPHKELVKLSSRVLKGLTYRPTGAIVAAATTSLPEDTGGERNWDYRYAWIRDASMTLEALYIGACSDEAEDFVSEHMREESGVNFDSSLEELKAAARRAFAAWNGN